MDKVKPRENRQWTERNDVKTTWRRIRKKTKNQNSYRVKFRYLIFKTGDFVEYSKRDYNPKHIKFNLKKTESKQVCNFKLQSRSVCNRKLQPRSVCNGKLQPSSIWNRKLQPNRNVFLCAGNNNRVTARLNLLNV